MERPSGYGKIKAVEAETKASLGRSKATLQACEHVQGELENSIMEQGEQIARIQDDVVEIDTTMVQVKNKVKYGFSWFGAIVGRGKYDSLPIDPKTANTREQDIVKNKRDKNRPLEDSCPSPTAPLHGQDVGNGKLKKGSKNGSSAKATLLTNKAELTALQEIRDPTLNDDLDEMSKMLDRMAARAQNMNTTLVGQGQALDETDTKISGARDAVQGQAVEIKRRFKFK